VICRRLALFDSILGKVMLKTHARNEVVGSAMISPTLPHIYRPTKY
jgi:hypothetical protein